MAISGGQRTVPRAGLNGGVRADRLAGPRLCKIVKMHELSIAMSIVEMAEEEAEAAVACA